MALALRPLLLTMGDPVGIGPEIVVRAFQRGAAEGCVIVGDVAVIARALAAIGWSAAVARLDSPQQAVPAGSVPVWAPFQSDVDLSQLPWGHVDGRAGQAAADCVFAAARAVLDGQGSALVTAPLNKAALAAAGIQFPGHTEMLQALAGGVPVRMMLANDELRVVLVTIHQSLRSAIDAVTYDAVLETLRIVQRSGVGRRIAVAGLNPHAGEDGLFGDEESRVISKAIAWARTFEPFVSGTLKLTGAVGAETAYRDAKAGRVAGVVAMFHDQATIASKLLDWGSAVNVTWGLPYVRTSVDHGVAWDAAERGDADPSGMIAAARLARALTRLPARGQPLTAEATQVDGDGDTDERPEP